MKLRLTFFFCVLFLFSARPWGQTWNLTSTMTATLDGEGVLTISDSEKSEAMPEYYDQITGGIPDYGGAYPPWYDVRSDIHSIIISDRITTIGQGRAFQDCSNLTSVVIPNSVVAVSSDAFRNCSALTSMTVGWATPLAITSFSSLNASQITLHVPTGTKTLYAAATGWKDFGTIVDDGAPSEKQTWFLTSTMTATLDNAGVLTIATTESSEAMPDYYDLGANVSKNEIPIWIWANLKVLSVVVENGVTSIGNNSFFECSNLTSITLPNSLKTIGIGAFNHAVGLTSVTLPNSLKTIGDGAFQMCSNLISVSIPDNSVTTIGNFAFSTCTKLASITIPNSVVSIGNNAFTGCVFPSLTIPNSVKSIGLMAFGSCGFSSIAIPNSIESIGDYAFSYCTALKDVTVGWATPLSVPATTFSSVNTSDVTLHVPEGTKTLYQAADVWKDFGTFDDGTISIVHTWNLTPTISATLDNKGVLTISDSEKSEAMPEYYDNIWGGIPDYGGAYPPWYNVRSDIHSIIISDKITTIGQGRAFQDCPNLTSVVIPNSVVAVSSDAFQNCSALTSMTVGWVTPLAITSFSSLNASQITLHVPTGTKTLYAAAAGWKDFGTIVDDGAPSEKQTWFLTSTMTATLDNEGVLTIATTKSSEAMPDYIDVQTGNAGYRYSPVWYWVPSRFHSVVIKNGVSSIGNNAFQYCSNITSLSFDPNSVTTIGYQSFVMCTGLTSITLPNSLKSIGGGGSFYMCTNLVSVSIPDNSATFIGNSAFTNCKNLTSITIPNSVDTIGNSAFSGCTNLTSITIPNSVKSIETNAFGACGLTSITIPNSVKSIGAIAFGGCSFTSLTIPNSIESIGDNAFSNCTALKDVTVGWATPLSVPATTFSNVNTSDVTLHVPEGTKMLYQAADVWKDFGTIDDGTPDYTLSVSTDSLRFIDSGEQKTFAITSNTSWTVASSDTWLTVSPTSGSNDSIVKVTAEANTDKIRRTATVTVSGTGVTAQTIAITQDSIPGIPVTAVALNDTIAELTVGEILQLLATITPENATDKTVFWSSSDTTVARVDTTGKVSALAAGLATVTVTTADSIRSASCLITVKDISVEVPDTITVAQNGKGTIALSLTIPSDATLTGSFEIQFPDGMTPDIALCVLAPELAGSFTLSFTSEGNNTWLITISAKGLKSSQAIEYRKIMDIAYQVADTVASGSYEATIRNLDFALDNGTSIQEDSLTIPITVSGSMTAIDNVRNTSFYVSVINQKMKVVSPNNELITIYSVKGDVLYSTMKNSGPIEIPVSSLHGSVVIIKGSVSGTIKVVR